MKLAEAAAPLPMMELKDSLDRTKTPFSDQELPSEPVPIFSSGAEPNAAGSHYQGDNAY